jgi:quercetin dioxygenase-like cupin family protein
MNRVALADVDAVEAVDGVHLAQLAAGAETSVQHFRIEPGATVPEHSHPHEQTGYLTAGSLTFHVDGEEVTVSPGDAYTIPGGEPHAAENRGDVVAEGVEVFSPPRPDPDWGDGE